MTQHLVITTPANTQTGDSPKAAFDKLNANDTELYTVFNATYAVNATETSLGITPTNIGYPYGDARRYGAMGAGFPTNDSPGIQAAINVSQVMFIRAQLAPGGTHYLATGLVFQQGSTIADTFKYHPLLEGNFAQLSPAAGTTAISIVPRNTLGGSGSSLSIIDMRNFTIDGGVAGAGGANAIKCGLAGYNWDSFPESGIYNVCIQNFQAQTTVNGGVTFIEGRHLAFDRFIVRQGQTVALLAQTSGSFCGDMSFTSSCDIGGAGSAIPPLVIMASGGGAVRGIKWHGDIYGPGTLLKSTGAGSQVGDIWFAPGAQFDGINADTGIFLELYATASGQLFNVQVTASYFVAVNETQAIYVHMDTGGTMNANNIIGNRFGSMAIGGGNNFAVAYCSAATGFHFRDNTFDQINGTGGTNPAYIKIASSCSSFMVESNNATNQTAMAYGVYLDASSHTGYSVLGNMMACSTAVLFDGTLGIPARQIGNNLQIGGSNAIQFGNVQRIVASAIPFVIAPTGTMANNGAITLGTALPTTYANCYLYLPASAIFAGSTAGWYYTQMSSTTAGTVFNNTYTTGIPTIPGGTAFVTTGPGAYTGVITQQTMQSLPVAGNLLGPNGVLVYEVTWTYPNNANTKTLGVGFGSTYYSFGQTTTNSVALKKSIRNRGVTNVQVADTGTGAAGSGSGASNPVYGSTDTSAQQFFNLTGQLAVATDFIVSEYIMIEAIPG